MSTMDAQTARRVDAEIAKLIAESSKLNAEAAKFQWWYPVVLMATAVGVTAAVMKLVLA